MRKPSAAASETLPIEIIDLIVASIGGMLQLKHDTDHNQRERKWSKHAHLIVDAAIAPEKHGSAPGTVASC